MKKLIQYFLPIIVSSQVFAIVGFGAYGDFDLLKYPSGISGDLNTYGVEYKGFDNEIIKRLKNLGINCPVPSGKPKCDWVIVDTGEVIVHLFREEIRALYSLEKLWGMNFNEVDHKSA